MSKHLETELYTKNLIIQRLQSEVGVLVGKVAYLETQNAILSDYINQEKEKKEEEDKQLKEVNPRTNASKDKK